MQHTVHLWTGRSIVAVLVAAVALAGAPASNPNQPQELRFAIRSDPRTFNPALVGDESSETLRYLTGGVLIRLNRRTQQLEPSLALKWKILAEGRRIDFQLRPGVRFSDGSPFTCDDVAFTMREMMNPALHSPTADSFGSGNSAVQVTCTGDTASVRFPHSVAALDTQFDQVAIRSAKAANKDAVVLGPFVVAQYSPGHEVLLRRNSYYWRSDEHGRRLPYLDTIRLEIRENRDTEVLAFRRGELHLINKLDPNLYEQLKEQMPDAVIDAGPSLDWEVVWFNQVPGAPIPQYKKEWFRSTAFRKAISLAINRDDMCRLIYRGHAQPSLGAVAVSNQFWLNHSLKSEPYSVDAALQLLTKAGFKNSGGRLFDSGGHAVEFSVITNAGNRRHEQMLAMMQQDLRKLGIAMNAVSLEMASVAERISRNWNYEGCLLSFTNIDLDPNGQLNVWLSSALNHQWNPAQSKPATGWEAELDRLLAAQASATDVKKRKAAFDQAQQVIRDQAPMIFLVSPNALSAVSTVVKNVSPAMLRPQTFWNAEMLYVQSKP